MMRKLTLAILLFIGSYVSATAQVRDSVTIHIPPYTDTTCPGTQLVFSAVPSSDTFTALSYHWYVDNIFTGITLDTFLTTALNDNDSVYCWLVFTNSLGNLDSSKSNTITIHHLNSIPPRVLTAIISGSNPDCAGNPLVFQAYPINGGITPQYQWFVNGVEATGADSTTFSGVFGGADTVTVRMISSAGQPCAPFDTAYSIPIPVIHIHLIASMSITAVFDTICGGALDTFNATAFNYGTNSSYTWYVNGNPVSGVIGDQYITDSLAQGDSVYAVLTTTDTCVLNPVIQSNVKYIYVKHVFGTYAAIDLTAGDNPGCLDSSVTFTARFDTFGTAPYFAWYVDGVLTNVGSMTLSGTFANTDIVSFVVAQTDGQCYTHDTINVPGVVMIRDTTPVAPVVHLHGDTLLTYSQGTMTWYHCNTPVYGSGTLIPGATDTFYHPTTLGWYYCVANNANCPSLPSNFIYISLLEIQQISKSQVNIYPNPTTGILSMDWKNMPVTMSVTVYNAIGQNVLQDKIENKQHFDVDLSSLPPGNYYLELRNDEGRYDVHKIILEHK